MNRLDGLDGGDIGDAIALRLQSLRVEGEAGGERPLLRLDYREQAAVAPFQFDIACSKLHRTECPDIPPGSRTALYGVWEVNDDDLKLACGICRPQPVKDDEMKKNSSTDMMYGFLSILDQFGSVLVERGKEYRNSEHGKEVAKTVEGILSGLDNAQKEAISSTIASLDGLLRAIQSYNAGFTSSNGNGGNGNGAVKGNGSINGGKPRNRKGRPRSKKS